MEMEVDTSEYLPRELRVTVEGGTVRVVGDHQEKDKVLSRILIVCRSGWKGCQESPL